MVLEECDRQRGSVANVLKAVHVIKQEKDENFDQRRNYESTTQYRWIFKFRNTFIRENLLFFLLASISLWLDF